MMLHHLNTLAKSIPLTYHLLRSVWFKIFILTSNASREDLTPLLTKLLWTL